MAGLTRWPKLRRNAGWPKSVGAGYDGEQHLFAVSPRHYTEIAEAYLWTGLRKTAAGGLAFKGYGRWAWLKDAPAGNVVSITPGTGSAPAIITTVPPPDSTDFFAAGAEAECATRYEEQHSVSGNVWDIGGFRDVWNAIEDGDFIVVMPDVQLTQATPGGEEMSCAGLTLLQRPQRINKSSTAHNIWDGVVLPSASATWFPRTPPNTEGPVRQFRYRPGQFANLTAVKLRMFILIAQAAGNRTVTMRLRTGDPNGSPTTVYSQGATADLTSVDPATSGMWAWESEDLRSYLTDGQLYWWEMSVDNFDFISFTPKTAHIFMDYEQLNGGFGKTTTFFGMSTGKSSATVIGTEPDKWWPGGDRFSAADFQKIDDTDFVRPIRQWSNVAKDNAAILQFDMRTKKHDETDASRDCVFSSSPDQAHNPASPSEHDYIESTLNNSDELPLNCLGSRQIYDEFKFAFGANGRASEHTIAIEYTVPTEPSPALGDLFPLDAFNPEGCTATSAGGGIPGVLLIANGSQVPQKFVPYKPTNQQIEDAGIPTPFPGEGSTIESNSVVNSTAISPTGGAGIGVYKYRYTFRNCCTGKESDPNPEDITIDTTSASPRAAVTLSFLGVRIPADPQICEICIYRTVVDGAYPVMAKVGCLSVDASPASFIDDLADDQLDFTNEALSILNAPVPCVPYIASFNRRIFGIGDIPSLSPAGTVSAQNGSNIILGDFEVEWDRCWEGKFLQLQGDCRKYQIERVLPPESGVSPPLQRLKLYEEYEGTSQTGANYTVCGDPNLLVYSEPEEPEYWPVVNAIPIETGDGDIGTGVASSFNRLIVTKRTKTYLIAYRDTPALEVSDPARISSDIGCVGPRTFTQVENATVWLADRGIALFDGRGVQHLPVSDDISNIFTSPDDPLYMRRNSRGLVLEAVAVNYPAKQQYWLGIPTIRGNRGFDLIIVWDYKEQTIFCYEFCNQFLSMVVGKDTSGNQRIYLGDDKGFIWVADTGYTDGAGVPDNTGSLRGTVTAVPTTFSFDDENATFLEGGVPILGNYSGEEDGITPFFDEEPLGLAGACVYLRNPGETTWTERKIWLATKQRIFFTPPISSLEVGAEYMIAPINFLAEFKPWNLGSNVAVKRAVDLFVIHEPEEFDSQLRVEFLADFEDEDRFDDNVSSDDTGTIGERTFKLSHPSGKQRMALGRIIHTFQGLRLSNFAPEEPIRVLNVVPTITKHHGH